MAFSELKEKITITVDGKKRELFMSFGLLSELTRLAVSPDGSALFMLEPELRDKVRRSLLAERTPGGKIVTEIEDPDDLAVSIPDTERMLTWAMEHVLDFFVRAALVVQETSDVMEKKVMDLRSSPNGSTA